VPTSRTNLLVAATPVVVTGALFAMFWLPSLRPAALRLLGEYGPIEMATFLALSAAGVGAIAHAWSVARRPERGGEAAFFLALGVVLLAAAGEEISWGQWFFHFATPPAFRSNVQGELNVHNLPGLHGHSELLRLAFGLAGLVGVVAGRRPRFAAVGAPPALASWFVVIVCFATFDVLADDRLLGPRPTRVLVDMAEVIEMLIGFAAVLYVAACARRPGCVA